MLGRSDATLNRHGVRIGTAEIYRSLANLPEVDDSLIVNLDLPGGRFFMPLFVKLRNGSALDEVTTEKIRATLRREYSPRHVPDKIYAVDDIPMTLTGKKLEVPVRRILMGVPVEKAANRDAVANPKSLDYFIGYAKDSARLFSDLNQGGPESGYLTRADSRYPETKMEQAQLIIGGRDVAAQNSATFARNNPITGEEATRAAAATVEDARAAADAAAAAFPPGPRRARVRAAPS